MICEFCNEETEPFFTIHHRGDCETAKRLLYVVDKGMYSEYSLVGIFSTMKHAEEFIKKNSKVNQKVNIGWLPENIVNFSFIKMPDIEKYKDNINGYFLPSGVWKEGLVE